MSYETAKKFWGGRTQYPKYPNTKKRRLIDVNFIMDNIENPKSVLDLGCGDGYMLLALREFTYIEYFYGYDISKGLLSELKNRWGKTKNLKTKSCDFTENITLPEVDLTLSMGLFPYIFEYKDLYSLLSSINSNMLIVRSPCTLNEQDEYINKYSEDLEKNYSAVYRRPNNYLSILHIFYKHVFMERAYSDDIESKYGTKHFFFVCEGKKK